MNLILSYSQSGREGNKTSEYTKISAARKQRFSGLGPSHPKPVFPMPLQGRNHCGKLKSRGIHPEKGIGYAGDSVHLKLDAHQGHIIHLVASLSPIVKGLFVNIGLGLHAVFVVFL